MARQGDRHQQSQAAPLGPETLNIQGLLFFFLYFGQKYGNCTFLEKAVPMHLVAQGHRAKVTPAPILSYHLHLLFSPLYKPGPVGDQPGAG